MRMRDDADTEEWLTIFNRQRTDSKRLSMGLSFIAKNFQNIDSPLAMQISECVMLEVLLGIDSESIIAKSWSRELRPEIETWQWNCAFIKFLEIAGFSRGSNLISALELNLRLKNASGLQLRPDSIFGETFRQRIDNTKVFSAKLVNIMKHHQTENNENLLNRLHRF